MQESGEFIDNRLRKGARSLPPDNKAFVQRVFSQVPPTYELVNHWWKMG